VCTSKKMWLHDLCGKYKDSLGVRLVCNCFFLCVYVSKKKSGCMTCVEIGREIQRFLWRAAGIYVFCVCVCVCV